MRGLKSHFVFNRSQRNGIFLLLILIILLQAGYFFIDFSGEDPVSPQEQEKIAVFQRKIDSLKGVKAQEDRVVLPFNPNYISDYKGYTLGMSLEEIDRLHDYRSQDKWVNSAEEFQEVTGISDSLLVQISPAFKFPEWVQKTTKASRPESAKITSTAAKDDLNSATAAQLQEINGIGEVLSKRIVSYRESLGGFNHAIQVRDVYGLSPEVIEKLIQKFQVFEPVRQKVGLNDVSLISLSNLPYMDYELARKIVRYRETNGEFSNFEELLNISGFPADKLDRIKLYLSIN